MDPLAHTLVGATLAETGLRRATPLATATLILGANAPDLDAIAQFAGSDASLYWRRGLTHGVLSMALLPIVLTGVMLAWDRFVRRRRDPDLEPARPGILLALSYLSVLTHPALDWLNTYGVRLLMPFHDGWFYGDALFIVDPWMWLLLAAAVVLGRSSSRLSAAAWIVLGSAATALIGLVPLVPLAAKIAWLVGVGVIVALRLTRAGRARVQTVAIVCVSVLLTYIGLSVVGSRIARRQASAWFEGQGIAVHEIAAGPEPANPFVREIIARSDDAYHFAIVDWLGTPSIELGDDPIPLGPRTEIVERALATSGVRGMRNWMRFPTFEVEETPDGHRVTIRDVRYSRMRDAGIGTAVVELTSERR